MIVMDIIFQAHLNSPIAFLYIPNHIVIKGPHKLPAIIVAITIYERVPGCYIVM